MSSFSSSSELGRQVSQVLEQCGEEGRDLPSNCIRNSLALLRLLNALRGIAGMKLIEEEVKLLVSLINRRPPPSVQGLRLVNTGLSILIACNSLIARASPATAGEGSHFLDQVAGRMGTESG